MSLVPNQSYSHTCHFVNLEQFNRYIFDLANSDKLSTEKKLLLQKIVKEGVWKEIQHSSYWRHNIFNGGLSGPFTEYFASFNPQWKVDFWGEPVQPIDIKYLSEHAIPRAYQSTVVKTQQILSKTVKELLNSGTQHVQVASLACGTMYDVLGTQYEDRAKVSFFGYDIDQESLRLVQEKAKTLGYRNDQITLSASDVICSSLPENQYDIIICNGFSFYVNDESIGQLIEKVNRALKANGIFLMSFIQPATLWRMNEAEEKVNKAVQEIFNAVPMNWTSHLRTGDEVCDLVRKNGWARVSVLEEEHHIHPLLFARK